MSLTRRQVLSLPVLAAAPLLPAPKIPVFEDSMFLPVNVTDEFLLAPWKQWSVSGGILRCSVVNNPERWDGE